MTDPTTTPTLTEPHRDAVALAQRLDVLSYDLMVGGQDNAYRSTLALSGIPDMRRAANLLRDLAAVSAAALDEREAEASLARAITASLNGRTWASLSPLDHARTALAWFAQHPALAARPAPTVSGADDQAAAVKAVEQYPTLTVTAWSATPEQAEAIFEAAMDAAYAAAGDIALDGVATLVRRTVTAWTVADARPAEEGPDDR